jgi:uncharacterized phage protein (TIGR02220 family)
MSTNSTIRRARRNKENPYAQIRKAALRDDRLSWKARGILGYILTNADDWKIYVSELANHSQKDGRDSTANGIKELIEFGYVSRTRKHDDSGKFSGYDYTVTEYGNTVNGLSVNGLTVNGKSVANNKELKKIKNSKDPLTPQGERSEDFDVTGTDAPKQQNETETPTPPSPPAPATPRTLDEKAAWLLNYWNKNVRRDKRALTASIYLKGMKARLKDGASGQDCVNVIKDRVLAWYHDDQMNKNVDPVTLFRKANFSRYLDSWHDRTEAERRKVSDITKFIANPPKPGQAQAVAPRPVGKTSADQIAC